MGSQYISLPWTEQTNLAISLKEKYDTKKMELLMRSFNRYIRTMAYKKSTRRSAFYEDLISVGNMAIFRAVEKYDFNSNNNFYHYAKLWINAEMKLFIKKNSFPIKMGGVAFDKIANNKDLLTTDTDDVVKKYKLRKKDVDFVKSVGIASLTRAKSDDESDGEEYLASDDISPENFSITKQMYLFHRKFMAGLTEREKLIWTEYVSGEINLAEIGRMLILTRQRIQQISVELQEKFKRFVDRHKFKGLEEDME